MKTTRILAAMFIVIWCMTGLGAAYAVAPETDPQSLPAGPFAQNVKTGEIIYLSMGKEEAEAITGAYVEQSRFGKDTFVYEGITLAFRDEFVVFITIEYDNPRWAANGVATTDMSDDRALEALGMPPKAEDRPSGKSYVIYYFDDGTQRHLDPNTSPDGGRKDYQWLLTFDISSGRIGQIQMGDEQYLLTRQ